MSADADKNRQKIEESKARLRKMANEATHQFDQLADNPYDLTGGLANESDHKAF